jgi:sugar lactone lactonase YvrE
MAKKTGAKPSARKNSGLAKKTAGQPVSKKAGITKHPAPTAKTAPDNKKGLMVFGAIVAIVVALAVIGKLRQGPPVRLVPVQVEATITLTGTDTVPLSSPRGIAVDSTGAVYVADMGNNRVVKFKPDGTLALTWGATGTDAGQFKEPSGVAVNAQNEIFVADAWTGRVQKFTAQGEYLGEITSKSGNFYSPRNVVADSLGFIYVADTGNSCVKKFDTDANLVKRWGEYGPGRDRFMETFGIAVDKANQIYVGDAGNRKIKVFTNEGKFVREIRVKGWKSGVSWPIVAVDPAGRIYASDTQNQMIWVYDQQGKYLGSWGNQPGKDYFAAPLGLAVDAAGAVYVSDMNRGQVLKLAPWSK